MPDALGAIRAFALLPGFPRPEVAGGCHYEAEKAYVQAHGLPRPILVDGDGVVWAGRTLCNVCLDLGIPPVVQVVSDGHAAAVQELATRDLTVLDLADLVRTVYEDASTKFVLASSAKRSVAVGIWFRDTLGKSRGFSTSQVEQYLRVARCVPEHRAALADAETLHQAITRLRALEQPLPAQLDEPEIAPVEPSAEEEEVMQAALAFTDAMERVPTWTPGGVDILRSLREIISGTLRTAGKAPT